MSDILARYRSRVYITVTIVQYVFMLTVCGILEYTGITKLGWTTSLLVAFAGAALLSIVTITLVHMLGRPLRDLAQTMADSADESTSSPLPTPIVLPPAPVETLDSAVKTGLKNMQTGLVVMGPGGKIIYYNDHAPVRKDTDDNPVLDLIFPDWDTFDSWLSKKANNKITVEKQWTRIADKLPGENDRRIFDVSVSYRNNSPAETVLTFFDRTNTYTPEEDDMDFIAFAAHELRGPITVIRGYLDVLGEELQPLLERDQAELMQRLVVTSNRLSSYVNNILNTSRYDRRHLKLRLNEEKLRRIYETIADDMQLRASAQNRVLVVDIPEELPTIAADTNSIGEVLSNLIDNAIKYSNEGGLVHVTAHAIPGFIEVSVIDRGIGMPNNIMPHLFHKFYRSHRSRETVAGTGIGLYICKAIVSSHGGIITARSVEHEGSTFTFTLPIYDTVADKLKAGDNSNVSLIEHGSGWIKNHSLYRG